MGGDRVKRGWMRSGGWGPHDGIGALNRKRKKCVSTLQRTTGRPQKTKNPTADFQPPEPEK